MGQWDAWWLADLIVAQAMATDTTRKSLWKSYAALNMSKTMPS